MEKTHYKNARLWTCEDCEQSFYGRKRYFAHLKCCEKRKLRPHDRLGRVKGAYDKKLQVKKSLETKIKNGTLGHPCSDEQRAKIAEAMIAHRKKIGTFYKANVSIAACKYIDELNIKTGWNLAHGLHSAEKQVGPYFIDGYDEQRNIAFEYYEKAHHKNKKREERDEARARYIVKHLNCKLYIYDEKLDMLYEFKGD